MVTKLHFLWGTFECNVALKISSVCFSHNNFSMYSVDGSGPISFGNHIHWFISCVFSPEQFVLDWTYYNLLQFDSLVLASLCVYIIFYSSTPKVTEVWVVEVMNRLEVGGKNLRSSAKHRQLPRDNCTVDTKLVWNKLRGIGIKRWTQHRITSDLVVPQWQNLSFMFNVIVTV